MKKSIYSLFVIFTVALLASCASTKSAKENSPAGDWDYSITGTPQGDFSGIMTITKTDAGYTGQLVSSQGTLPFSSTKYSKEENKVVAEFDYSGMPVLLTGMISGTTMTGTVATSGYEFPLSATKKTP
jgi:hypothetical protein